MKALQKPILALLLVTLSGLGQLGWAGPVGTEFVIDSQAREASLARVETLLASDRIAKALTEHGVDQSAIVERLSAMTNAEVLAFEGQIDELVAGEGVLGLVGAVFVVLLILELVGVTDIFKSI